jgi:Cft2 family RNA processing exonuclease
MDARRRREGPVFVSHAHSDHIAKHDAVIVSEPTAPLMRARVGGERVEHVVPFGETREFEIGRLPFRIELLPAGHILGSAMALIEAEGGSLLYTGDFKLRGGLGAERCEPGQADVLVMETTFGKPEYRIPPAPEVFGAVIAFCRESLEGGSTAVLYAYSLGKSQELLLALEGAGLPVALHREAARFARIYEEHGVTFPPYRVWDATTDEQTVLIWPPAASRAGSLKRIRKRRSAVVTGWALDAGCRYRYGVDEAFPVSDHSDFDELLETVERVSPRVVYTVHGFAAEFAQTLRERGVDARALGHHEQLTFSLPNGD